MTPGLAGQPLLQCHSQLAAFSPLFHPVWQGCSKAALPISLLFQGKHSQTLKGAEQPCSHLLPCLGAAPLQQQLNPSQCWSCGAQQSVHWARTGFPWGVDGQGLGLAQPKAWGQRLSLAFFQLLASSFAPVFSPVVQPSKLEQIHCSVMLETCDLTGPGT